MLKLNNYALKCFRYSKVFEVKVLSATKFILFKGSEAFSSY